MSDDLSTGFNKSRLLSDINSQLLGFSTGPRLKKALQGWDELAKENEEIHSGIALHIQDGATAEEIRKLEGYKELHRACADPEINRMVSIETSRTGALRVMIGLKKPYCLSPDHEIHLEKPQPPTMGNSDFQGPT